MYDAKREAVLKELCPAAIVSYGLGGFRVYDGGHQLGRPLSKYWGSRLDAVNEAIKTLEEK